MSVSICVVITDASHWSTDACLNTACVIFTQLSVNWGFTAHRRTHGNQWNYIFKLESTHARIFQEKSMRISVKASAAETINLRDRKPSPLRACRCLRKVDLPQPPRGADCEPWLVGWKSVCLCLNVLQDWPQHPKKARFFLTLLLS